MNVLELRKSVLVIDDFLPTEVFKEIQAYHSKIPLFSVHHGSYSRVWTLADGQPLQSAQYSVLITKNKNKIGAVQFREKEKTLEQPEVLSETPVHEFFQKLIEIQKELNPFVGRIAKDWLGIALKSYFYPQGSSLSWHNDSDRYSGAFTYYSHDHWNRQFGGELLVELADQSKKSKDAFSDGIYFTPKPNRLIVFKGGVLHKIAQVTPLAGPNYRTALSGFFLTKKYVEENWKMEAKV